MKYSLQWLNEIVSIEDYLKNPKKLKDLFNLKGLEVEQIQENSDLQDYCFDIIIAPNRPDLFSHIGLARELSALLNRPMKLDYLFWINNYKKQVFCTGVLKNNIQPSKKSIYSPQFSNRKMPFKVTVKEPELCPFYSGQIMTNVQISPSPLWLKQRLALLGLNSINNVVDVTNWILQEWGQPLHAFDLDTIKGNIQIRKSKAKDRLTALDDKEIEFYGDELIIGDDEKPLALAGIIGGKDSGITDKTKNIFIESAVFAPYAVRRIARRFKMDTDSSFRFSKGVDPHTTVSALQRACSLIQQIAGGQILKENYQINFSSYEKKSIEIDEDDFKQRLDYSVSLKEFSNWMKRINCQVKKKGFSRVIVTPPEYRRDLTIKEDLIEEWARFKGYESVNEIMPSIAVQDFPIDPFLEFLDKVKKTSKEQGYYQAINYSFIDSDWSEKFLGEKSVKGFKKESPVFIENPISQDLDSLRQSLLPGLFKNVILNIRHGQDWGRLFEQGVIFEKKEEHFDEIHHLSFIVWGQKKTIWQDYSQRSVFFDLKSTIETILNKMNRLHFYFDPLEEDVSFLHPKRRLLIKMDNQIIGFIGVINPILTENYKIRQEIAVGELDLSLLFSLPEKSFHFHSPSSLPVVRRDISLVIEEIQPAGLILESIRELAPSFCKNVSIIDCYEGEGLKKGQRSITFRLTFQGERETLSEHQISQYHDHILKELTKKYSSVHLR